MPRLLAKEKMPLLARNNQRVYGFKRLVEAKV